MRKLILFLLASILLITFSFYTYQICYTPNILVGGQDRVIIIPDETDFGGVQKILHEGQYVQDLISFSFLAKLMDYDEAMKPGRYVMRANMTNIQAVRFLRLGLQEPVKITFNNVRLIPDLSEKITRNLEMKPPEFEAGLIQFAMHNDYGFNKDNVLCMFIPNTYEVYYNISTESLLDRMHGEFENFWTVERKEKAKALELTPIQVSILPPGPINMPEINSLDAVLNYFHSDYIYMCAKEDFSGRHNFTGDYEKHLRNAERYQKALTIEIRKGKELRRKQGLKN